jgi:hypothetical protein
MKTTAQVGLARRFAGSTGDVSSRSRQKLGSALYQAQIGERHESAKMLHGFSETAPRLVYTKTSIQRVSGTAAAQLG